MRDLTDAPPDEVAAQRARVATEGWGGELLARQDQDGLWGSGSPDLDFMNARAMVALREFGLDPTSDEAQRAVGMLRDSQAWLTGMDPRMAWAGRPFFAGETEPCINGRVVAVGSYFRQDVQVVVDRLLGEQMADGGWNCDQENGSTRGSFHSTINVLEGFLEYERAFGASEDVRRARERGEEYLLERRLFRRLSTGAVASPDFLRFSAPPGYRYHVLRGLDYLRETEADPDERVNEAVEVVSQRRTEDGRWLAEDQHPDEWVIDFGEAEGSPSRWNTLRGIRVLRWGAQRAD